MRSQNPPPGSPPFEPDRPTAEQDVSLQAHAVGPSSNIAPCYLSFPAATHEASPSSEPTLVFHISAYTQSHHHFTIGGVDETEEANEEGDHHHDIVDAEDGGAPLDDMNMEEIDDQSPASPPQGTLPAPHTTTASLDNMAPQSPQPVTLNIPTNLATVNLAPVLQQDVDEQGVWDPDEEPHPLFLTNANPGILMPVNHNFMDFLQMWRWFKRQNQLRNIRGIPRNELSLEQIGRPRVTYEDLKGDEYDFQGINWQRLGVTRREARKCRSKTFRNYTNKSNSDAWNSSMADKLLTRHDNYFRFSSMDLRTDVRLVHFQLRNILGCASRTAVYYPSSSGNVQRLDPTTGCTQVAMKFRTGNEASVSTLVAEGGMLVTGSFFGTYRYCRLGTETESHCHDGVLTTRGSGITNHVQVSPSRRSPVPIAAFSSNDCRFRMVDMARNKIVFDRDYKDALNCAILNPDKTLRVVVGDTPDVLITEAETGKVLERFGGHRDFGFACDWAPDGWTVATANQDRTIRIWDARKWRNSKGEGNTLAVLRTEMAGARNLRFSPLGSGKRLLLAAEEADVVNIIDAQTFNSKQTIDVFGELAGVSFAGAGQEIVAMSTDPARGGIIRLERCDYGTEDTFDYAPRQYSQGWRSSGYDWLPTPHEVVVHPDSQVSLVQKRRQAAMTEDWFF